MPEVSNGFVSLVGIGTVFVGLICIVFLCTLMSALCRKFSGSKKTESAPAAPAAPAPSAPSAPASAQIPNRQEFIAAVSAVLAEEMGTDVSALRILSVKRV